MSPLPLPPSAGALLNAPAFAQKRSSDALGASAAYLYLFPFSSSRYDYDAGRRIHCKSKTFLNFSCKIRSRLSVPDIHGSTNALDPPMKHIV